MSNVHRHLVEESLAELTDVDYQTALWLGEIDGCIGSPVEATEQLIDDSGLGDALGSETLFDYTTDALLAKVVADLHALESEAAPRDVLASTVIKDLRRSALVALCALVRFEHEESNLA